MQTIEPLTNQPSTTIDRPEERPHGGSALRERAKVAVLLGLAVYFVYNINSGNLANYVNQRFAWLSYVAVALFLLLGIISLVALLRGDRDPRPRYDGNERTRLTWPMIAIVAIPLMLGTLVPSQPLGAAAVQGRISVTVGGGGSVTAFSKDPLERNVLDWLRTFAGTATPASFNGQEADFVGFVYREPDMPANHFMVARFTVSCCVADASAIGLPVYWPETESLEVGEWVRVRGIFQAGLFRDTTMPILQPELLEVIEQPQHPYLYP